MKTKATYVTRDGKSHSSFKQAESHSLSHAARMLRDIIQAACPKLDNAKGIADMIVFKAVKETSHEDWRNKPMAELREFMAWLEDSFVPNED
jgi:hypothetical protein